MKHISFWYPHVHMSRELIALSSVIHSVCLKFKRLRNCSFHVKYFQEILSWDILLKMSNNEYVNNQNIHKTIKSVNSEVGVWVSHSLYSILYGLEDRDILSSISGRGKKLVSSLQYPNRLWGLPGVLPRGPYRIPWLSSLQPRHCTD
jgi:hypothetical protein